MCWKHVTFLYTAPLLLVLRIVSELIGAGNSNLKALSKFGLVPHGYCTFLTLAHIGARCTNTLVWRSFQSFHWFWSFWPILCKLSGRLFVSGFRSCPFVLLILELCLLSLICSPCCRCLRPANWWARPSSRWNSSSKEKERRPGQFLFHDCGIRFSGSGYSFLLDVVPGLDPDLGLPKCK